MDENEIFPVDNEDDDVVVTVSMDDGTEVTCEILTIFDCGEREYIVLLPLDDKGEPTDDGEVYIYRYQEDENGVPSLDNIASDEEYDAVAEVFNALQEEAFGQED